MEEEKRSYYAIIPANVRYDKTLPANAKLLYGEITALCNEKGYCWATNDYFAKLYEVSKTSISKWISSLIQGGYIRSEIIYKEGSKEILNRYLRIVNNPIEEKLNRGNEEKLKQPIEEKLKDNNKSFNNTLENNTSNNTLDVYIPNQQPSIPYQAIVDYLNIRTGSHYKATTKKTKDLIKARFNEGFTFEDFKTVIDKKCVDWLKDKNMNMYLRPETLFGTKFESYLNQQQRALTTADLQIDLSSVRKAMWG